MYIFSRFYKILFNCTISTFFLFFGKKFDNPLKIFHHPLAGRDPSVEKHCFISAVLAHYTTLLYVLTDILIFNKRCHTFPCSDLLLSSKNLFAKLYTYGRIWNVLTLKIVHNNGSLVWNERPNLFKRLFDLSEGIFLQLNMSFDF